MIIHDASYSGGETSDQESNGKDDENEQEAYNPAKNPVNLSVCLKN